MDVRCEKCQTVYEFDDAKVTTAGVTVKCTQCGNLFKVRRRATTTASQTAPPPRPVPGAGELPPERQRRDTMPRGGPTQPPTQPRNPTPMRGLPVTATPPGGDDRVWLVRLAGSGEVKRFRELTTLQQWIVEKRVSRDDEISRSGDTWKRLGGIAELASFFHVVEQAQQRPGPTASEDPALSNTAPMTAPSFAVRPQAPRSPVADQFAVPPDSDGYDDDQDSLPRSGPRPGMVVAAVSLVLVVGGLGYLALFKRAAIGKMFGGEESRSSEAYKKGRELFQYDSDDQLRLAEQQLLRAHGADENSALPLAGLAELNARWGGYLRDDAHEAEAAKQLPRSDELRKLSSAHLEDAKRYANEAVTLAPDDPEVNRARAAFLLVDGAPASQIEGFLKRSEEKHPDDEEAAYLRGALYVRDRRLADAKVRLEQANSLHQAKLHSDLFAADMMLAEIAFEEGRRDEARVIVKRVIDGNAKHDRARALLARIDAPVATPDAGAAETPPPTVALPQKGGKKTDTGGGDNKRDDSGDEDSRGGFDGFLTQGNKLLERGGRTKEAQKAFEKALALQPTNTEALNGLGYCYLDTEHFAVAVDTFKRSLGQAPKNGDAILGLAEAYKMQGNKDRALEFYKKYVAELPGGSKIRMATTNVRDLESQVKKTEAPIAGEVHDAPPLPSLPTPPPP